MIVKVVKRNQFLKVIFKATLKAVDALLKEVNVFLHKYKTVGSKFGLDLCLREALNNAIVHGAGEDEEELILFWLKKEKNRLCFFVRDPGSGFNYLRYGQKPNELTPSGWGIFLLANYTSGYKFFPPGNKLLFWFDLEE